MWEEGKKKKKSTLVIAAEARAACYPRASHTSAAAVFNSSDLCSDSFVSVQRRILMGAAASLHFYSHSPTNTVCEGKKQERKGKIMCPQVPSEGGVEVVEGRGWWWWLHKLVYRMFPVA